jgi:hypothetical protein
MSMTTTPIGAAAAMTMNTMSAVPSTPELSCALVGVRAGAAADGRGRAVELMLIPSMTVCMLP